jgi:hypothetical protein
MSDPLRRLVAPDVTHAAVYRPGFAPLVSDDGRATAIGALAEAMAVTRMLKSCCRREYRSALRLHCPPLAAVALEHANDVTIHSSRIDERIRELGGGNGRAVDSRRPPGDGEVCACDSLQAAIAGDLACVCAAVERYRELATLVAPLDPSTHRLLAGIGDRERARADDLAALLGPITAAPPRRMHRGLEVTPKTGPIPGPVAASTTFALDAALEVLHEPLGVLVAELGELEGDFLHGQIQRTEMMDRLVVDLDADFSLAVVDDHFVADDFERTLAAGGRQFTQELGMGALHLELVGLRHGGFLVAEYGNRMRTGLRTRARLAPVSRCAARLRDVAAARRREARAAALRLPGAGEVYQMESRACRRSYRSASPRPRRRPVALSNA